MALKRQQDEDVALLRRDLEEAQRCQAQASEAQLAQQRVKRLVEELEEKARRVVSGVVVAIDEGLRATRWSFHVLQGLKWPRCGRTRP